MGKRYTSIRNDEPLRIVLVSKLVGRMTEFSTALAAIADVEILQADSGEAALQLLADHVIDLIAIDGAVSDMTGLEMAQRVAQFHPFVSSVLVSEQSEAEFHEQTEGLGVLMSLPDPPNGAAAEKVLQHMAMVHGARAN